MNRLQTYTLTMPCTPVGNQGPLCPPGWESVGYTKPGTCSLGNVPGEGPADTWQMYGYNRVCKRKVETSGDLAVDCCSNLTGVSNSVECRNAGYTPYSDQCNNVMVEKCNTNVHKDPYGPEWNGMPGGQNINIFNGCNNTIRTEQAPAQPGCMDKYCVNYLRHAPPNNFFHTHDFSDYPYRFPRHSYTTPDFAGGWGYQPMRVPYKPYTDLQHKNANNYCRQFPQECFPYK
jgi:hypothetical protein